MTPTRSTRFSPATCTHCGRTIVGLYHESAECGITKAECQPCHKRRLVTELQRAIQDKQRKAVR